jgi:hypothetical protein
MLKHSIQNWGAQYLLTIQGNPAEVAVAVNHYCNHGMFLPAAIPAAYDETKHSRVTVNVSKGNLRPGLISLATVQLIAAQGKIPREKRLKGEAFHNQAMLDAESIFAGFVRENLDVITDEKETADLRDYKIDEDELDGISACELRRRGRAILRGFFGKGGSGDASRSARVSAE